ncbi:bifunctional [glutamate--ammonia ligase]-adenylyl-L-tyrosine phosphorylase/[glutamate--ammonia-ligase] adenylyltransferase [Methylococcus geothermalis]|uniref:Bifunctional glutamine synthetase adenylyltransferase/adenylyl-removing enzyme n=1 Tax=Methylococcus geothermalis TaxID=2681310 RepID=A0A858QCL4_9GAMM|nr:bifunctional [glutamate--ammonia ligase]-adenylyl-L-tyrosine phosphorylase/[glutamate--ammonia-ligase] adenylyltransferase [Methylococcus geothermalis]
MCEEGGLRFGSLPEPLRLSLGFVGACSPFFLGVLKKDPSLVSVLRSLGERGCRVYDPDDALRKCVGEAADRDALARALRQWRNREMAIIAWQDISGQLGIDEVLARISHTAEAAIRAALSWLFEDTCRRWGVPRRSDGSAQNLVVLGMGKLGGRELNFSSDVDLIFAYLEDGELSDRNATTYAEFYTRLARALVQVLDAVTEDGFVFRVDLRLRPFGDSGPLVVSFDSCERYYQAQARDWERYAMVKVRAVGGDPEDGAEFERFFQPFVYRRYLDYRVFGELRSLKGKIVAELRRKDRGDNIKLGPGGIREIEFIGQAFQLIRGGRHVGLQDRSILVVLERAGQLGLLDREAASFLCEAYRFLRKVENRLQEYEDKQTHDLPTSPERRELLAYSMGFDCWDGFGDELERIRRRVHGIFSEVIAEPSPQVTAEPMLDGSEAELALALAGFGGAADAMADALVKFRASAPIRRLGTGAMGELHRVIGKLLAELGHLGAADAAAILPRVLRLLESIAGRGVYFSLLAENPAALSQLVKLAAASPWIMRLISSAPILLDELLDPRTLYSPLTREALAREADILVGSLAPEDEEQLMLRLRQFKAAHQLRIAAADIMKVIPVMVVSDYLTDLAEVMIERALRLAWRATAARHGVPPVETGASPDFPGFGVIAYGKLGGIELGYGSDLDLVFLYDGVASDAVTDGPRPVSAAEFYARVIQRLVSLLTTEMLGGALYEVDLRLRPSGSSGLLVSKVDAYENYQLQRAWTWERQALVRARFVAGDPQVGARFDAIRRAVLCTERDSRQVRLDILAMREKMRESLMDRRPGVFDLKQGVGGIADIEFIVQFGVLVSAAKHCEITRWTDTVRLLESLLTIHFLTPEQADRLRRAYCDYRGEVHRLALQEMPALASSSEFTEHRMAVQAAWKHIIETPAP